MNKFKCSCCSTFLTVSSNKRIFKVEKGGVEKNQKRQLLYCLNPSCELRTIYKDFGWSLFGEFIPFSSYKQESPLPLSLFKNNDSSALLSPLRLRNNKKLKRKMKRERRLSKETASEPSFPLKKRSFLNILKKLFLK